jgi:hypothetical protein
MCAERETLLDQYQPFRTNISVSLASEGPGGRAIRDGRPSSAPAPARGSDRRPSDSRSSGAVDGRNDAARPRLPSRLPPSHTTRHADRVSHCTPRRSQTSLQGRVYSGPADLGPRGRRRRRDWPRGASPPGPGPAPMSRPRQTAAVTGVMPAVTAAAAAAGPRRIWWWRRCCCRRRRCCRAMSAVLWWWWWRRRRV